MFHVFGTPGIGKVFLPMHFSIFIAGIFWDLLWNNHWFYNSLINSLFGMPIFPQNIIWHLNCILWVICRLIMYLLKSYNNKRISRTIRIYISLILSMILGRMVNAIVLLLMARLFNMNACTLICTGFSQGECRVFLFNYYWSGIVIPYTHHKRNIFNN